MPDAAVGHSRKQADYRFPAIREPLRQLGRWSDAAQLPLPTQEFGAKGTCKLFGMVTNPQRHGRPSHLVRSAGAAARARSIR